MSDAAEAARKALTILVECELFADEATEEAAVILRYIESLEAERDRARDRASAGHSTND